jgi:uncharacterized protein YllA (UPF0747 family)
MSKNVFPTGWDENRVKKVIAHYQEQTEDEAVAEDEAAYDESDYVTVQIPRALISAVRDLISKYQASHEKKLAAALK